MDPPARFSNFSRSSPATQRCPYTTNSLSISYWSAPYSPMQPRSGVTHHRPIIDISKYYNPNVLELSVTTLDVLLSHTFIPPSHSNPFTSLFIAEQQNSSTTAPHTHQPSRLPNRELHSTRSPRAVHKIYTQTDQTHTGSCSVFYIVLIFHCWYLYVFHTHIQE